MSRTRLNATYLGDTDFNNPDPEAAESGLTVPPEGNGHQAEFTRDNQYVDRRRRGLRAVRAAGEERRRRTDIHASQGSGTKKLAEGETITGQSKFVGRACDGDPAVPAGDGTQVAVVERGVCDFTEKVANVIAAGGYDAVLIFNRTASDGCNGTLGMSVEGDIPTFGVAPREQGFAIFDVEGQYDDAACLAGDGTQLAPIAVGTTGDTLTFSSYFDGWGYVHLFENGNGKMKELDTYAIPEAHDPAFADGLRRPLGARGGDVAGRTRRAPTSRTTRAASASRRSSDGKLVEKGHYIDADGNNFWGVAGLRGRRPGVRGGQRPRQRSLDLQVQRLAIPLGTRPAPRLGAGRPPVTASDPRGRTAGRT